MLSSKQVFVMGIASIVMLGLVAMVLAAQGRADEAIELVKYVCGGAGMLFVLFLILR